MTDGSNLPHAGNGAARLARLLPRLGLPRATPVLLPSEANDAWRIGDVVLRVCWRGDRHRFLREAAVTVALPPTVPYPEVLDVGQDAELAWQVTRAIEGVRLADAWDSLSTVDRRSAINQLGTALQALHTHRFPDEVLSVLRAPRPAGDDVGGDINPLPTPRLLRLVAAIRPVDPPLLDKAEAMIRRLADLDPLARDWTTVVHGDAHTFNVFWRDGRVVALLDFEWVRPGRPDMDLEPYLRGASDISGGTEEAVREVLGWLAETCPGAFAAPDLIGRLWLYQIAFAVRELHIHAHPDPRRLRQILRGPEHLYRMLPGAPQWTLSTVEHAG